MKYALVQSIAGSILSAALFALPFNGQAQDGGRHIMVLPGELKWSNVSSLPPGAKIAVIEGSMSEPGPFTVRLRFPANYLLPAHSHPAIERVTVLSGTFHMGSGDKLDKSKTHALPVGGAMIIPAGSNHFAWTAEETVVQLNGIGPWGVTYVNPADDPRKK
ncbi:MAG: cupin domain-containing protein [Geminicoccaceae bacterium]